MSTLRVNNIQDFAGTGVASASNAPALSASRITTNQSITTATWTKAQLNSVGYDPTSDWDAANFRFIPQVAGLYNVVALIDASGSVSTTNITSAIYKNGSLLRLGAANTASNSRSNQAANIPMNGTTDYIELFVNISGSSPTCSIGTSMDVFLARPGV